MNLVRLSIRPLNMAGLHLSQIISRDDLTACTFLILVHAGSEAEGRENDDLGSSHRFGQLTKPADLILYVALYSFKTQSH